MEYQKPKGFKKNVENIWYHYKYVILIALAALIMFGFAMAQSVSKKDPDIFIYHISKIGLTAQSQDDFCESMKVIAEDYNGDGTITVDFKEEIYIPNEIEQAPGQPTSIERFNLELAFGECILYIMDESFYRGNRDYMCDLSEFFDELPASAYDDKAILISKLPGYHRLAGLQEFEEDAYLCIRKRRAGMDEAQYTAHIDFLKKLVEYRGA